MKDRLGALLGTVDPLGLLDEIRTVQHHLAALATGATVHPMPQRDAELDRFLRSLAVAWRAGEVRPAVDTEVGTEQVPSLWTVRFVTPNPSHCDLKIGLAMDWKRVQ